MGDTHGSDTQDQHGPTHAVVGGHGSASDHGAGHGSASDHGAEALDEALGPIGWTMWGAGVLGVVAALMVTAGFVLATGFDFGG